MIEERELTKEDTDKMNALCQEFFQFMINRDIRPGNDAIKALGAFNAQLIANITLNNPQVEMVEVLQAIMGNTITFLNAFQTDKVTVVKKEVVQ